jgi:hypothetical protein
MLQRSDVRWLLFVIGLVLIWTLGLTMKAHHFGLSGFAAEHTFWMESAQRFRYIEMISEGQSLPDPDERMQSPDGYSPWTDTVLQEQLYGRLHRSFAAESSLGAFVRALTPVVSSLSIFGVALLVLALSRRRGAALFAGLLFAVALPVAQRGIGTTIFREDLAFPVLCFHLAALAYWTRTLRTGAALTSGLFLALALLLWKVVTFYYLLLVFFLGTAHWLEREQARRLLPGASALLLPAGLAGLLPLSLRADSFVTSTSFIAGLAVLGMLGIEHFVRGRGRGTRRRGMVVLRPMIALGLFGVLRWLLPSEQGYSHAWETIIAKLRFGGVKPLDPAELSFHARHYWTGNYESPTAQQIIESWPWLLLLALPGVWVVCRGWFRKLAETEELETDVATAAGVQLVGRLETRSGLILSPLSSHFGLWMLGAFGFSFLCFRKLQLFFALALVVLAGLGFARFALRKRGRVVAWLALALLAFLHNPSLERTFCGEVDGPCAAALRSGQALADVGYPAPRSEWRTVDVFPGSSFDELAGQLPIYVGEDEPVLASFVVSPFLLAHLDRPTVLHCFFEGDLLDRLREVMLARFGSEEELWEVSRRTGAKWYLHEAHQLLRTDPRMSARYVADSLDWPAGSVLTKMQFAPEELSLFGLVWENDWFRLYRVLEPEETAPVPPQTVSPVWSRALFSSLYGDPFGQLNESLASTPEDLLFSTLSATRDLSFARRLSEGSEEERAHARAFATQALLTAPYLPEGEEILAELSRVEGQPEQAAVYLERATLLRAALSGQIPFPASLHPRPVLLDDGR